MSNNIAYKVVHVELQKPDPTGFCEKRYYSSWIYTRNSVHNVRYIPEEWAESSNGTPLFVFENLQDAIYYAVQRIRSDCEIWRCEFDEIVANNGVIINDFSDFTKDELKSAWSEVIYAIKMQDNLDVNSLDLGEEYEVTEGCTGSMLVNKVKLVKMEFSYGE